MRRAGGRGWIAAAAALLACAGCGFKGPLYLPARNPTVVTHPAQGAQSPGQTPSPAAKGKSKASPAAPQSAPPQNPPPPSPPPPPVD